MKILKKKQILKEETDRSVVKSKIDEQIQLLEQL